MSDRRATARCVVPGVTLFLLCACGAGSGTGADSELRIVSLAPHITELVYSAGAGDALVGVVAYSDYPDQARDLPRIGDAFRIDHEALARLAPSLVLAWDGGNPAALIGELTQRGYRVEALRTGELSNIAGNLRRIGALAGKEREASLAAAAFLAELRQLEADYADVARLRVFFQIGRQPLFTVNDAHAIGQIVALCGGVNVFADLPALAASVGVESVVAHNPDVLLTLGDPSELDGWLRFKTMRAVENGHIYGVNADLIARDSVRILQGAHEVCAHLDAARAASP